MSGRALAVQLGTSPKTLRNTIELLAQGDVVAKHGDRLWLHPDLGVVVGVDVTLTTATVAVSRFDLEPHNDPEHPDARCSITIDEPETSLREIARLIAANLSHHAGDALVRERLVGVGLTLPGPILRERSPKPSTKQAAVWDRRIQAGWILPGWDDVNVAARLATILKEDHGLEPPRHEQRRFVWVENDASAGALGVHTEIRTSQAEAAPDDLLYVRISNGIGAGIMIKGHLVTGARGFAGELGHVAVDGAGTLCSNCGGSGCLETVASNPAVLAQLRATFRGLPSGQQLEPAPGNGTLGSAAQVRRQLEAFLSHPHPAVDRAVRDAGTHLGTTLAAMSTMLNPALIVLAGLMPEHRSTVMASGERGSEESRPFVAAVKQALDQHTMPQARSRLETKTWDEVREPEQRLTPELLGALALVIDHLGDAYLLSPIERWIRTPRSRQRPLRFSRLV